MYVYPNNKKLGEWESICKKLFESKLTTFKENLVDKFKKVNKIKIWLISSLFCLQLHSDLVLTIFVITHFYQLVQIGLQQ